MQGVINLQRIDTCSGILVTVSFNVGSLVQAEDFRLLELWLSLLRFAGRAGFCRQQSGINDEISAAQSLRPAVQ